MGALKRRERKYESRETPGASSNGGNLRGEEKIFAAGVGIDVDAGKPLEPVVVPGQGAL